ncbi:hypothetical protein ACFCXG_39110, partial [Streptomyces sp. NPDC056295]
MSASVWTVPARAPDQLLAGGLLTLAGIGLLEGAELAQYLELVGAGRDPGGLADLGFQVEVAAASAASSSWTTVSVSGSYTVPGGAAAGSWSIRSPLGELRAAVLVVGQVLVPEVMPGEGPGVFQGRRDGPGVPALHPAPIE